MECGGGNFFSTGVYSPYRTLAVLNGLIDPQTFGRTPWLGDQSNTRPLPKHRTTQKYTDTHPCSEQDLNLRSQCSSGRRQYMPQTARLLRPAVVVIIVGIPRRRWEDY
jgi:hypothetical protein